MDRQAARLQHWPQVWGCLSAGSDIGGSIRVPAHFCGIYGHKPTLDLVNPDGHQPGGGPSLPGFSTLLAVAGPMARSAEDLLAALKVMGGPFAWDAKAWKWDFRQPAVPKRSKRFEWAMFSMILPRLLSLRSKQYWSR